MCNFFFPFNLGLVGECSSGAMPSLRNPEPWGWGWRVGGVVEGGGWGSIVKFLESCGQVSI